MEALPAASCGKAYEWAMISRSFGLANARVMMVESCTAFERSVCTNGRPASCIMLQGCSFAPRLRSTLPIGAVLHGLLVRQKSEAVQ